MYEFISRFASRPAPHSRESINTLWTRPHIAERMLSFHLDQDTHFASRPICEIDKIVHALDCELDLKGKRLCDLGCGPGLYSTRFAALGAEVTGIDLSSSSIDFARRQEPDTGGTPKYVVADYLRDPLDDNFDVVTLIYFDFCALSPPDRSRLLTKIGQMLKPGGCLALDVVSEAAFRGLEETLEIEKNLMDGFWSASEYTGIHRKWLYSDLKLTVDHYGICEKDQQFEVFNWMQFFSRDRLVGELEEAGFTDFGVFESLNGQPISDDSHEIGILAR